MCHSDSGGGGLRRDSGEAPTLGPGGLRSEAVAAGAIQARSLSAAAELQCISNGHGHGHAGCDPTAAAGERRRGRVMACA